MGVNVLKADVHDVLHSRIKSDDAFEVDGSAFEFDRGVKICGLATHVESRVHSAASHEWVGLLKKIVFSIEDADAGWAAHLVSAHREEIAIKVFDVDLHMRRGLGAIDNKDRAMFVGDCGEFFDWGDIAKDVGDLGHCDDLGFWTDGLLKVFGG